MFELIAEDYINKAHAHNWITFDSILKTVKVFWLGKIFEKFYDKFE